jgi:hypothetical protein
MPFDSSPTVKTDEVLRVLVAARKLLEHSWLKCDGNGGVGFGPYPGCANDMLWRVEAGESIVPALECLMAALPTPGASMSAVFDFNDDPDTTHDDIKSLFDRAIAARRKELDHA